MKVRKLSFSVPSKIKAKNREEKFCPHHKVVHQVAAQSPTHGQTGSCEGSDQHPGHEHQDEEQDEKWKVRNLTLSVRKVAITRILIWTTICAANLG